jgi:hypothetical protein
MPAMSSGQLPLPAAPLHHNQQLFSDHYLDVLLPGRADWRLLADEAAACRPRVAALVAGFAPSKIEAQTEHELVRPILAALGHTFEVQAPLATPLGTKKPDYVFYRDAAALNANKGAVLDEARLAAGGLAVGEVKYWDRPLDVTLSEKGDPFENRNPAYQIAFYMLHSGAAWGILTNGRLWRLYQRDSAHKLERFYEVDLPALLAADDPAAFVYFYGFFRRAAFDPGPLGLAELLAASRDYATAVGDTLKGQVYEALRGLAQGFLDYPPNGLTPDAATLKAIYDHALIVLYRLLFVFYAEARGLLPVGERELYRSRYSLYAIARDVARDLTGGVHLLPGSATLWPRLVELFRIIDAGSPPLQVATFNGGLFDPDKYPFLARCTVGDAHLQQAIDRLARVAGQFIDYRDLAERHLGTIYEGLLEYHLEPERPLGSSETLKVCLVNDRGERHATGSYYTPDYIVKYIVEQAVGPALRAAVADKADDRSRIAAVLDVNVLDPAMGSGHFLVEATETIARFLVDLDVRPDERPTTKDERRLRDDPQSDLAYWKRRVAQSCIYGVDLNPLAVDLAKLSLWLITAAKDRPLSFLDHHLRAGDSLVGARLADLLHVKPDRSRRPVRSRGTRAEAAGQMGLFAEDAFRRSLSQAVDFLWLIEDNRAETVADVKQQEQLYAAVRAALNRKYGRLADLATATRFGLAVADALWGPLAEYAAGKGVAAFPKFDALLAQADDLARRQRFFHWELEFPEVFFDRHGQPLGARGGFDAVIGNPPYVRQEALASRKPFLAADYPDVYQGTADLFVYFFAQGMRQLRAGGRLSYIASNSWLRANYASALRAYLRSQATVETLVDVGDNRVFADAPDVYPAVLVVRKAPPPADYTAQAAVFTRGEGVKQFASQVAAKLIPVSIHDQPDAGWQLGDDAGRRVFAKLMAGGRPLGEVVEGRIYYGVKTGLNEAFIIDRATRDQWVKTDAACATIVRPIVNGEDIRPWFVEDEGRWLIFTRRGIDVDSFPQIKTHLERFRARLEPKPVDWNNATPWPGRKPGPYQWYEIQDTVAYYQEFEKPKILWPEMAKYPRFTLVEPGVVGNKTTFMVPGENPYLLGVLMTRATWFAISQICAPIGERAGMLRYMLSEQFMSRLPIPDAPAAEREAIGGLALAITAQARARYALHRQTRHRILDLRAGSTDSQKPGGAGLNQKLTAWWELDFPTFRGEIQKIFRRDIPLKERDEWEAWLAERRSQHDRLTAEIVRLETDLNRRVYGLFDLNAGEVKLIEASTKYRYGEV